MILFAYHLLFVYMMTFIASEKLVITAFKLCMFFLWIFLDRSDDLLKVNSAAHRMDDRAKEQVSKFPGKKMSK